MKLNRIYLPALVLFLCQQLKAQNAEPVFFRSGTLIPQNNIRQAVLDSFNTQARRSAGRTLAVLQFTEIPTEADRKLLSANGIELLEYIPNRAYTVSIRGQVNLSVLQQAKAKSLFNLRPEQKMDSRLLANQLPAWTSKQAGTTDVWISFPKTTAATEAINELRARNIEILSAEHAAYRILSLRIATARLTELASYPFVEYVQAAPRGDEPLLYNSRYGSRANVLNASIADGGKALNGEGVAIGIGDNADVQFHVDFSGRLINRSPLPNAGHGSHVTGIVGGAGLVNEMYRGFAPKSTLISQAFNGIILNASTYVNDYGMVITNNSYGDNIECGYYGTYDLYSRLLDQMAFDLPKLQNVFSAGNSGASSCSPFQPFYHTVLGGYQSAKNVLTVGATTDSGAVASFSSRGPVKDGRTKPEIVAMGQFVASTWTGSFYSYNNGTSMSSPAVAGGMALVLQRYRQLNGGADPKNGLMKAVMCNGSQDRGNPGPDYQYGFGWMNLLRSVDMVENNHYFNATVTNGATATHTISVPANTAQLKVMLYWNDPAASPLSAKTLVNDLDLELVDPSSSTSFPGILDSANANLNAPAVSGADHVNNMEQVVINNPAAGNYTIRVKGTAITQNPSQEYFVVYDPVPVQLKITSPVGSEAWHPSTSALDMMKISWEAYGFSSGTATLEFSSNGGASWSPIASNVNINRVVYTWWVPNVATSNALVRITKDGTGESSTSLPFTIIAYPNISFASVQCEGYITLNWSAVAGATDYEVMMIRDGDMRSVATTTASTYTIGGLSKDSTYWVTVRCRVNGKGGRRAPAISRQPNSGTCAGTISDNDLKLDAILSPVSGRRFTSTQPGAAAVVGVRIKNLDDAPVTGFNLKYSVNGGSFVSENVTATVNGGATYTYNFATTADLSAPGIYSIVAVVTNSTTDPVGANDTAYTKVKHLDNQPLDLTSYFVDNMETAADLSYEKDTVGLNGLDRYDFNRSTAIGRLRTFLNTGMAYSGSKALILDASQYQLSGNTNFLTGTYNLVNYNAAARDIRLDFQYNNHGQFPNANNKVWIRGNDAQAWIEAYDLDDNQNDPGSYKKTASIEVADLLTANGQNFGTSFQVRWGQWGQVAATDKENAGGYSFDDVRIYEVFNDLQLISIDSPVTVSCGLTSTSTIAVKVRNSANVTISGIPVRYRINNGAWVTETISVNANATLPYNFITKADLSAIGTYLIEALVDYPGDSFRDNDTARITVVNNPVIGSFPYLQNFEAGNGYWYSGGKKSSWEFGTPGSQKINRAASGAMAWKTRLKGNYNDQEKSYLYSPCFNLTGLTNPTLSFSLALDIEDCGTDLCDGAWVEYSADGITWTRLGAYGQGTNWYNKNADQLWSIQDYTRWHVATIALPTGIDRLRLRFVMASDPGANREGIAVDDIHIYDNTQGIYTGPTMGTPLSQTVSGNNWVDFTNGGKLVASIQPNGQSLGNTQVQAFINTAAVRFTSTQYYHDRNITIKPAAGSLADSVTVRFYFLDTEADTLVKATGCPSCTKPSSAYELGVSKYTDPDRNFENGSVADNNQGMWLFIPPSKLALVPFDKGYYAEFKVKDFSEFWLNNGGFDRATPLPVKLLDFTAQKQGGDALVKWKVAGESNVNHYEVEVAKGNEALQTGSWIKIGEQASLGNSANVRDYQFLDNEADKSGPRFYRLKTVDNDGSLQYSPIRSVVFSDAVLWQVFPNPSSAQFNLVYQLNNGEELKLRVLDAKGRTLKKFTKTGNGFVQKLNMDLSAFAAGVYLLQMDAGGKTQSFKLYKQ